MSRFWLFWCSYVGIGLVCSVFELLWPARKLRYWRLDAVPLDLVACALFQVVFYATARRLIGYLPLHFKATQMMLDIPLWVRFIGYYMLGDFGAYWMHRLMHTRQVWRVHRFHHSVNQLWWLSGVRATIPQQAMFNVPYIFVAPLLAGAGIEVFHGLMFAGIITNHWMHMNVAWRSNWLEKVFVTPRYHQIHHSADADQHDGNYGTVFTLWDRMFGTYIDPDTTTVTAFGTRDPLRPLELARYVVGV